MQSDVWCTFTKRCGIFARYIVLLAWIIASDGSISIVPWKGGVMAQVGCRWLDQGGIIDLSSLGNTDGTPRFKDIAGDVGSSSWLYSYNPCYPFSEGTCTNAAVCQTDQTHFSYYDCGYADSATLSTDNGLPAIQYTATTTMTRVSHVALQCDPNAVIPHLDAKGDLGNGDYYFTLTSVCACPNGCGGGSFVVTVDIQISIGWILVIVVISTFVLYAVVGVVFYKVRYNKTGTELIPNKSFWVALPGLIKDGSVFTFRTLTGKNRKNYQSI